MILKQYYLGCLAHASYLIADEQSQEAMVVDPQRDIQQYIEDAAAGGYQIKYVVLTHFHADFLAGHIELRNRTGAKIIMGVRAQAEFPFEPVKEGDRIDFGRVRIQILETPGHTPEGISLLVFDHTRSDTSPYAVLTGDTLFVGDVGRPDLLASIGVTADELAEMLYDSLNKLRALPDDTLVYPAHGAGSMCGKNLSKDTVSTIGEQRQHNYALQPMSLDDFRRLVTSDQPEAPDYFVYDAIKNRQERPDLEATLRTSLNALTVTDVLRLKKQGAQLVDVRNSTDFAGSHLLGSINIGLQGQYATWCGSVLSHDRAIVVVADPGSEEEAIMRLGRIGFDNVAGYLNQGMASLLPYPELIGTTSRISATALAEQLTATPNPYVLDIRSEREWNVAHLACSHNIPLPHLRDRLDEIPLDRPVVVHCEGGYRSAIGTSLLTAAGRTNVSDLVGGIKAWIALKLPMASDGATTSTCELSRAK